jgi:hypothetical protein
MTGCSLRCCIPRTIWFLRVHRQGLHNTPGGLRPQHAQKGGRRGGQRPATQEEGSNERDSKQRTEQSMLCVTVMVQNVILTYLYYAVTDDSCNIISYIKKHKTRKLNRFWGTISLSEPTIIQTFNGGSFWFGSTSPDRTLIVASFANDITQQHKHRR